MVSISESAVLALILDDLTVIYYNSEVLINRWLFTSGGTLVDNCTYEASVCLKQKEISVTWSDTVCLTKPPVCDSLMPWTLCQSWKHFSSKISNAFNVPDLDCFLSGTWKARRGYSQKKWVGVCGPRPKTPTLFMTKICDISYPIYDLTKNSKPYLWLDHYIKILLKYREQNFWRAFGDFPLCDNGAKVS